MVWDIPRGDHGSTIYEVCLVSWLWVTSSTTVWEDLSRQVKWKRDKEEGREGNWDLRFALLYDVTMSWQNFFQSRTRGGKPRSIDPESSYVTWRLDKKTTSMYLMKQIPLLLVAWRSPRQILVFGEGLTKSTWALRWGKIFSYLLFYCTLLLTLPSLYILKTSYNHESGWTDMCFVIETSWLVISWWISL